MRLLTLITTILFMAVACQTEPEKQQKEISPGSIEIRTFSAGTVTIFFNPPGNLVQSDWDPQLRKSDDCYALIGHGLFRQNAPQAEDYWCIFTKTIHVETTHKQFKVWAVHRGDSYATFLSATSDGDHDTVGTPNTPLTYTGLGVSVLFPSKADSGEILIDAGLRLHDGGVTAEILHIAATVGMVHYRIRINDGEYGDWIPFTPYVELDDPGTDTTYTIEYRLEDGSIHGPYSATL